jgi:hypothetical protein
MVYHLANTLPVVLVEARALASGRTVKLEWKLMYGKEK